MSIELKGLDGIVAKLDEVISEEKVERGIKKACAFVEREAKEKCPVVNGDLQRSIQSEVNGLEGKVFNPLEYAAYVEFGTGLFATKGGRQDKWKYKDDKGNWHTTHGQKPQPFLFPAMENNREKIKELIMKEVFRND